MLSKKQKLHNARLAHVKWLKSKGISTTYEQVCTYQKPKIKSSGEELDLSMYKTYYPIPTSDKIGGSTLKRQYATQLPAGKTISVAYNKGPYMVVDAKDFKTMGRKV